MGFFAFLLGIIGAIVIIGVIDFVRDDIKNEHQVSILLDTNLFCSLYYEKKKRSKKKKSILITSPVTSFLYSESIRKMATKLHFKAQKKKQQVILITSVLENEGKSTVAANLALGLVNKHHRVLLVDGDLRKPSLYKIFEKEVTESMEIGLCLDEKISPKEALSRDKDTGLYCMFGTKAFRNSDALLSSARMKSLIQSAKKAVDYIIIDSPPTSINSDAEIIAEYADAVLLVVRQGASRAADINDTLDTLRKSGTEVLGCVLNAVQTKILPKASEYGYGYGNYYSKKTSE